VTVAIPRRLVVFVSFRPTDLERHPFERLLGLAVGDCDGEWYAGGFASSS
jgi:hypothetical protein